MGLGALLLALQGRLMTRRRHAAPGGRVLATGVSVSATLGIMAGFAVEARTVTESTPTPPTTQQDAVAPTTIVTRVVERTIYVPAGEGGAPTASRSGGGGGGAGSSSTAAGTSGGSNAAAPAPSGTPTAAPAPAPAAPAPSPPVCSGSKC